MGTYWILEYGKIFAGYIFLMFIWPTVVFRKHLKEKSKIYHFSFCATAQIIIVNTIVLALGLLGILSRALVAFIFYGIFIAALWHLIFSNNGQTKRQQFHEFKFKVRRHFQKIKHDFQFKALEYCLLLLIVTFGVIYFSYGAFQVHTYGSYDVFTHHGWVNEMLKGTIFPDGIYPMGMHCFIYSLNALFGIRVYNIMIFLQCIHIITFLLSAYALLREIFYWRFTPLFVLALFLTINVNRYHGMYRLPLTLPMEFGLHTQFLCALFFIRYMKNAKSIVRRGKKSKLFWDADLLVFAMALAASVISHYYVTIMAFIACVSFALFYCKKLVDSKYLIPLMLSAGCGCLIAMLGVIGALASGIPFQGSIRWGVNIIRSNNDISSNVEGVELETADLNAAEGVLEPTSEDGKIIEKLPVVAQKIVKNIIRAENLVKITYKYGYQGTFRQERGKRIFGITIAVLVFCILARVFSWKYIKKISAMYFPVILISFISMLIYVAYASPELGLPILIPNHRFCPEGFLMVFAVMMMPADILFSIGMHYCKDFVLQVLSYAFSVGIYGAMNILGIFHGYLFYSLTRYDSAVLVTNSLIDEYAKGSYTIVSPIEEMYQVEFYGEHEEISGFLDNCDKEYYSIPTKYIFIYVEKNPIEYYQEYYFTGPSWIAKNEESEIKSAKISKEAAKEDMSGYANGSWGLYMNARTVLESKAYEWCQQFLRKYPSELNVYYEDDNFVCYYIKQNAEKPYNLAGE